MFWDTTLYYRVTDGAAFIFKRLAPADEGSNTLRNNMNHSKKDTT
jgi:hypothetical protein